MVSGIDSLDRCINILLFQVNYAYRIDVLHTWKRKCSPGATYDFLLHILVEGGFTDCATEMVAILREDWTETS